MEHRQAYKHIDHINEWDLTPAVRQYILARSSCVLVDEDDGSEICRNGFLM